jgi:hypothetical protein
LVTLVITHENSGGGYITLETADGVVSFEYLEVLYLGRAVWFAGCHFPRLRHASIWSLSEYEPEILTSSPYLESLLIRSLFHYLLIDVSSCPRLKLLGIQAMPFYCVNTPEGIHPTEHLWIFIYERLGNYRSTMELLKRLPRILRVTFDLSPVASGETRTQITEDLQRITFSYIGMKMRPHAHGDNLLIIERSRLQVGR